MINIGSLANFKIGPVKGWKTITKFIDSEK